MQALCLNHSHPYKAIRGWVGVRNRLWRGGCIALTPTVTTEEGVRRGGVVVWLGRATKEGAWQGTSVHANIREQ